MYKKLYITLDIIILKERDGEDMNNRTKTIIMNQMFPVFNVKEAVDQNNVGYTQGIIQEQIPFAAEVWKYEDEETLVVYLPDLGVINRNDFIVEKQEENMEEECKLPEYDLSVLSRYMDCKFVEGIFEINEFYKEYLEQVGMFKFTSGFQNGYVTYFEDSNGLDVIAFSVLLRNGEEVFAKCLLPLMPFVEKTITGSNNSPEDREEEVIMGCSVEILQDKKYVTTLGTGMEFIYDFALKADKEIPGSIQTKKGWYCNRDVVIRGSDLLMFIRESYPEEYQVCKDIIKENEIYTVVATDYS